MQFHTPFRTYRFCILPQGYVNGTAAFFRDMNRSIAKCKELCKQCDNFHPTTQRHIYEYYTGCVYINLV